MRLIRILALHFEHVTEHRARSFVWFLVSLFNPLFYILFWRGALQGKTAIMGSWTFSTIASYYFLLTVIAATLMSHIEEDIGERDIKEGMLIQYLLKPYSYFWKKFYEEIHYRILQGGYGIIVLLLFFFFLGVRIPLVKDPTLVLFVIPVIFIGYFLSFFFKMIVGFISFWTTDIRGLNSLIDITLILFAGYVMPITLLIHPLDTIAKVLPFSYMIYFPVTALQGAYNSHELLEIIGIQVAWLMFFMLIYKAIWNKGLKEFTGVGQ